MQITSSPALPLTINSTSNTIKAGQVVSLTTRIGVAGTEIAASAVGSLHVKGVFSMPKATGAIAIGAAVYYNASTDKITTTASSAIPAGWAIAAAKSEDATVQVCIG